VDQSCHLVVPSREQIVVIARIDPPGEIGLVVRVGHRRPMSQATSGHVLLAFQTDEVQKLWLDMIAAHEPELDRKKLLRHATQVRTHGYATAASHIVDGVTDLSAPVLQHGSAVCALTVPFIERRASAISEKLTLEHLRQAAADISDTLQYGGPSRAD
jgi:DNA-binding IclR family transcriptional regulator